MEMIYASTLQKGAELVPEDAEGGVTIEPQNSVTEVNHDLRDLGVHPLLLLPIHDLLERQTERRSAKGCLLHTKSTIM
jgi:hypothetical protein